MIAEVTRGLET